jgi:small acid-soluble spore protein (thioredoxin-like protein)
MKKHNPDDRRDNVKNIQKNIDATVKNMELAEDMAAITDSEKTKQQIEEKNDRRKRALEGMRHEIKDEAKDRENGYK